MDAEMRAREAGMSTAARRLRALHVKGMLVNAIQLAAAVVGVPLIV
jgi:hypothetical protein